MGFNILIELFTCESQECDRQVDGWTDRTGVNKARSNDLC